MHNYCSPTGHSCQTPWHGRALSNGKEGRNTCSRGVLLGAALLNNTTWLTDNSGRPSVEFVRIVPTTHHHGSPNQPHLKRETRGGGQRRLAGGRSVSPQPRRKCCVLVTWACESRPWESLGVTRPMRRIVRSKCHLPLNQVNNNPSQKQSDHCVGECGVPTKQAGVPTGLS